MNRDLTVPAGRLADAIPDFELASVPLAATGSLDPVTPEIIQPRILEFLVAH